MILMMMGKLQNAPIEFQLLSYVVRPCSPPTVQSTSFSPALCMNYKNWVCSEYVSTYLCIINIIIID